MDNNRWIKLAVISLVGIVAAYAILWLGNTVIPNQSAAYGSYYQQHNPGYQQSNGYYMGMPQGQGPQMMPGMNMQGSMNGTMNMQGNMGNMNMQGGIGMGMMGGMGMHH